MRTGGRRRELRLFFVTLFLGMSVRPFPARGAEVLRIVVPAVVRTEETACALSEIAALEGDPELVERAGALLLTVNDGAIERQQVIDALKVSGLESVRIELKMPVAVQVEPGLPVSVQVASGADSDRTEGAPPDTSDMPKDRDLIATVKALAAWDGDVEVRYRGVVPEGRLVYPTSLVPGTGAATLRFRDASGRERALAVRLTWTQSVLVLARSVKKDQILRESDFVLRKTRIGRPGVYVSRPEQAIGRSARKNLSQGEPLPLNAVADTPIIERGQKVTLVVRSGGLTVRARGEALESGAAGDAIRVRNLSGRTVVLATVTDKDTVEVKVP